MVTTTRSPRPAAPALVSASACAPSAATTSVSVSGPRELLITTSYPCATASRATAWPMFPAPMKPMVVMAAPTPRRPRLFPGSAHGDPSGVLHRAGPLAAGRVLVVHDQGVAAGRGSDLEGERRQGAALGGGGEPLLDDRVAVLELPLHVRLEGGRPAAHRERRVDRGTVRRSVDLHRGLHVVGRLGRDALGDGLAEQGVRVGAVDAELEPGVGAESVL